MIPFIDIHTHTFSELENIVEIVNAFPQETFSLNNSDFPKYSSVGVHPWHVEENFSALMEEVERCLSFQNVLFVGETGIDLLKNKDLGIQEKVFIEHVKLSETYGKPMILHSVKSASELLHLRKTLNPKMPWVIHGFRGNATLAKQLVSHGFYLSFGKKAEFLEETISEVPVDKIFLETDDDNVSIETIYKTVASMLQVDLEILKKQVYDNFQSVVSL